MYLMAPLCGDLRRSLNAANAALANVPMTETVKLAELAIDRAHSILNTLERECRAKEPA